MVSEPWGRGTATAWRLAGKSLVLPWASALMQKWLEIFHTFWRHARPWRDRTRYFCSASVRMELSGTFPLCFLLRSMMKKKPNPYQILDGNFNSTSQGEIPPRFPSHRSGSFFLRQQTTRKKDVAHFLYLIELADIAILYQQQTDNPWFNSSNRMY